MNTVIEHNRNVDKVLDDIPVNLLFNYLENKKQQFQALDPIQEIQDLMDELQNIDILMQNIKQKLKETTEIQYKDLRNMQDNMDKEQAKQSQQTEQTEQNFQIYNQTMEQYEQTIESYKVQEQKYKKQIEKQEYATDQVISKYSDLIKENEILKKDLAKMNQSNQNLKSQQDKNLQTLQSQYKKLRKFNTFNSEFNVKDVKSASKSVIYNDDSADQFTNIFQKKIEELVIKYEKSEFENKKQLDQINRLLDQLHDVKAKNKNFEQLNKTLKQDIQECEQKLLQQQQKEFKTQSVQTIDVQQPVQQFQYQQQHLQQQLNNLNSNNKNFNQKNNILQNLQSPTLSANTSFQNNINVQKTSFLSPKSIFPQNMNSHKKLKNLENFQNIKQQFMQSKNYMSIKDELQELQSFYLSNFNSIAPSECSELLDHNQINNNLKNTQQLLLKKQPSNEFPSANPSANNTQIVINQKQNQQLQTLNQFSKKNIQLNNFVSPIQGNTLQNFNSVDDDQDLNVSEAQLIKEFGTDDNQSLQSFQFNCNNEPSEAQFTKNILSQSQQNIQHNRQHSYSYDNAQQNQMQDSFNLNDDFGYDIDNDYINTDQQPNIIQESDSNGKYLFQSQDNNLEKKDDDKQKQNQQQQSPTSKKQKRKKSKKFKKNKPKQIETEDIKQQNNMNYETPKFTECDNLLFNQKDKGNSYSNQDQSQKLFSKNKCNDNIVGTNDQETQTQKEQVQIQNQQIDQVKQQLLQQQQQQLHSEQQNIQWNYIGNKSIQYIAQKISHESQNKIINYVCMVLLILLQMANVIIGVPTDLFKFVFSSPPIPASTATSQPLQNNKQCAKNIQYDKDQKENQKLQSTQGSGKKKKNKNQQQQSPKQNNKKDNQKQ